MDLSPHKTRGISDFLPLCTLVTLIVICSPVSALPDNGSTTLRLASDKPVPSGKDELDEIVWEETWESGTGEWVADNGLMQSATFWDTSSYTPFNGNNWRCFDPTAGSNGGYRNAWLQWLTLPPIDLSQTYVCSLLFQFRLVCEDPGGVPAPYDSWDGANVWLSSDSGAHWQVIEPDRGEEYNVNSLYSFGSPWRFGSGIAGWSSESEYADWSEVEIDLSPWAGSDEVLIRFGFASDSSLCTENNELLTGFQLDDIRIVDSENTTLFFEDLDGNNIGGQCLPVAGRYEESNWRVIEMEGVPSPDHALGITPVPTGFIHYFESPVIDLMDLSTGQTRLDVYVRGAFDHPGYYPATAYWTVKVSPVDSEEWYFASNPYDDPYGDNEVYYSPLDEWLLFSDTYDTEWDLTAYHGHCIRFRLEFYSPVTDYINDSGIWFDDFFLDNGPYDHDVEIIQMIIPFPTTAGFPVNGYSTFQNAGYMPSAFTGFWSVGDVIHTFYPPVIMLEPSEYTTLSMLVPPDREPWIPQQQGEYEIQSWVMMENDQNEENNSLRPVTIDIQPPGVFELGYDNRTPYNFSNNIEAGSGPLVFFEIPNGISEYSIQQFKVMLNDDMADETDAMLHFYQGEYFEESELLYEMEITASPGDVYPLFQRFDLSDVDVLQELEEDFWVWLEITNESGLPHPVYAERTLGNGNHYMYDGNSVDDLNWDWMIRVVGFGDIDNVPGSPIPAETVPEDFSLSPAYPNPFNPVTTIQFSIPEQVQVSISVYDVLGRQVTQLANDVYPAGYYELTWDASNVSSGIYFICMHANNSDFMQKVVRIQ